MLAGVHAYRVAEGSMALVVAAMRPVLVQGRQETAAMLAGCCSRKAYQADHR